MTFPIKFILAAVALRLGLAKESKGETTIMLLFVTGLNYTGCLELIFRVLDSLGHSANYKLSKGWNSKAESGMEKKDLHATYSYMLFFEK